MLKKNEKILITGCNGMLGEAVRDLLESRAIIIATDIVEGPKISFKLDISSEVAINDFFSHERPDYIIHLAALTDLEYCDRFPDHAFAVNAEGTGYLAQQAKKLNIPFTYISTAAIFDGTKDWYQEDDCGDPVNVYGKSKFKGEQYVTSLEKFSIIRAGWMVGGGPERDKKFVCKFINQLNTASELAAVLDKTGTITYTYDLARIIEVLLDTGTTGIFHAACKNGCSRADIASEILDFFNLRHIIPFNSVTSDFFSGSYHTSRPSSEKLKDTKLHALGIIQRDWTSCLNDYLKKFDWPVNRTS